LLPADSIVSAGLLDQFYFQVCNLDCALDRQSVL